MSFREIDMKFNLPFLYSAMIPAYVKKLHIVAACSEEIKCGYPSRVVRHHLSHHSIICEVHNF